MAASATASSVPGVDGECGYQHGMAPCLPMNGLSCCSLNGFCGSNETYCLTEFGCQYGCVPASYFTNASTTVVVTSVLTLSSTNGTVSATASASITKAGITTTKSSSSTSSTAVAATHGLTKGAKDGVVAGSVIGGVIIIFLLALVYLWDHRRRRIIKEKELADRLRNRNMMSGDGFTVVNHGDAGAARRNNQ